MPAPLRAVIALVVFASIYMFVYGVPFSLTTGSSSSGRPLLGLFITGPLGPIVGVFGGFIYWLMRRGAARGDAGEVG